MYSINHNVDLQSLNIGYKVLQPCYIGPEVFPSYIDPEAFPEIVV